MKAFPNGVITNDQGVIVGGQQGMDLRDYFAAAALKGMLSENGGGALCNPDLATWAFTIADAMMKARENHE